MRGYLVLCGFVTLAACNGTPTAPQPTPQPQSPQVVTQPAPTPAADPAPTPVPPPTPPAPRGYSFDAEVGFAYWPGQPVFPGHFEVTITPYRVEAGAHGYDVLTAAPDNVYVIAGTRNVETLTIEYHGPADGTGSWTWNYSGLSGQAYGGLIRR